MLGFSLGFRGAERARCHVSCKEQWKCFSSIIPNFPLVTVESACGVGDFALLCGSRGRAVVGPTGCVKGQEMVRVNGLGVVE